MVIIDLSGNWQVTLGTDASSYSVKIPGTLDENRIGLPDSNINAWKPSEVSEEVNQQNELLKQSAVIKTRFTRAYTYEGKAMFTKSVLIDGQQQYQRVFLDVERSRKLLLKVDKKAIDSKGSGTISTPYVFELTHCLQETNIDQDVSIHEGDKICEETLEVELTCDNAYAQWPREAIVYASAATDETQTNWNGLLGYVRLRLEQDVFISAVRVYPIHGALDIQVDIDANKKYSGDLYLSSSALESTIVKYISLEPGVHTINIIGASIRKDAKLWDEFEGNLHELSVSAKGLDSKAVTFGIRAFGYNEKGLFTINGRPIFLRSETNCCVFPETGHMPMSVSEWSDILAVYQSYGVNCVRFHSHCPPEAAFSAADQMGILLQPELSQWDPKTAFESQESYDYYGLEIEGILKAYANHPSFVMLTFGNELHANEAGHERMRRLLALAQSLDATRLFANGSNVHYGNLGVDVNSDFYTASNFYAYPLRGTFSGMTGYINHIYPNTKTNYENTMNEIRKLFQRPVFSFEVGQFEVLPDFSEIEKFHGVTLPNNLAYIKDQVEKKGFMTNWNKMVEASGEIARIAYREEVEAVLRTKSMAGISLLGLQDFPGQGTALVGMINSHMEAKPYAFAEPEQFKKFFNEVVPLALLDKFTYTNAELLSAEIEVANYGKHRLIGDITYVLQDGEENIATGVFEKIDIPNGTVTAVGHIQVPLTMIRIAKELRLIITVNKFSNAYPIWVYPEEEVPFYRDKNKISNVLLSPEIIISTTIMETVNALNDGKKVLYSPKADEADFPNSVKSQFTTDFWSVGTFPNQSGCMGCWIKDEHPIFEKFPTKSHSDWQWWSMSGGRAIIVPETIEPIVTVMDSYAHLRRLGLLFECQAGNGKLIVSGMGLLENQQYPEVRALLNSLLCYMDSDRFNPESVMTMDELRMIIDLKL